MYYSNCFRVVFTALIVVFGVISLFGQSFSLQINGQIRYAESKMPAENVLVRVESTSGGMTDQIVTDRTGKFSFTRLRAEQYIVTIHAPGFYDIKETIDLMTSNTGYVNALLVRDTLSLANNRSNAISLTGVGVVDANIPLEAQNEYTKAKVLIDERKDDKINEGIQHLEKAIAISPSYLAAQLMLGTAYMDLRKWQRAEKPLLKVIEINAEASTAYFALGEAYRREKKYAEAEKILGDGLKLNADSAEGHTTLAKVYWDMAPTQKDELKFKASLESSWKEVKRALELNPQLAEAHLLAGNLLLKARRAGSALIHFEEYLKLEPNGEFAADTRVLATKIRQALSQPEKK